MAENSVTRVNACHLRLAAAPWAYARDNAAAIDAHWHERLAAHPHEFNGAIHIVRDYRLDHGVLTANFLRTDFKSFMHWRGSGYPPAGALDAFGSAILRSAEGHVLLGRQRTGINAGLAYLPGGFIDARDVSAAGTIDIAASISRELAEETHLDAAGLTPVMGFLVTRCGPLLSIGQEFRSALSAGALRAAILSSLARDPNPELADIVIIRRPSGTTGQNVPPYTQLILETILPP